MITLNETTKKFGEFTALDNVSIDIPSGVAFGLLGSNGAGKSTILRLISGIYSPDSGAVTIDGENIYNNTSAKSKVFFINDETVQFGSFTLNSLKEYYKGFYPNFSEEIFSKLNETIKLPENKKIASFSKGMKRQAAVISGLSCCTEYLLMDEAFDGIDPTMRIIVKRMLIDAMIDRGMTVVISSHNLVEINEICDSVALLHKGKMLFSRSLDSVKGDIHKVQAAFKTEYSREDFDIPDILNFSRSGHVHYFVMRGSEEKIRSEFERYSPAVLDIIPLTLEEIFIYEMEGMGYDANGIV